MHRDAFLGLAGLGLKAGDSVATAKGTFAVLKVNPMNVEVAWLETAVRSVIWHYESVHGPIEVYRR